MPFHERFARIFGTIGFGARAVVYGTIGVSALLLVLSNHKLQAAGVGAGLMDTRSLLRKVLHQSLGQFSLGGLAVGFFCFALWRVLEGVFDYEHLGSRPPGLLLRAGHAISGSAYFVLGFSAVNLIFRFIREERGSSESRLAKFLLEQPAGPYLAGAAALGVIGFGIGQVSVAWFGLFERGLDLPPRRRWLLPVCRIGISARGVAFAIIGWFLLRSAIYARSSEAKGMEGMWAFLEQFPFGSALVTAMGIGLVAFAVYGFVEAAYRCAKPVAPRNH